MHNHSNELDGCRHCNEHLQRAFDKYGFENFTYDVLITCHPDMLLWYEQQFIDQWKPEYNMSNIAGKVEWTDDLRHRKSMAMTGTKHTIEELQKISDGNKGKKYSDETRRKMSESQKDRITSEETRRKLSEAGKGRVAWNVGKSLSEEHKMNISIGGKGIKKSAKTRARMVEAWKIRKLQKEGEMAHGI
jgi:group I intron endonuclease